MTNLDEKRLAAKVNARKAAAELVELLTLPNNYGADYAEALLDEMRKLLPKRREPDPPKPVPFARLAATQIPFGKYFGRSFAEVDNRDSDYLDWLCREQEDFLRQLKAYMKAPEREATAT